MLKYVGSGAAIIGVPARDLSEEEITVGKFDRAALLKSGLYVEAAEPKKQVETPEQKRGA